MSLNIISSVFRLLKHNFRRSILFIGKTLDKDKDSLEDRYMRKSVLKNKKISIDWILNVDGSRAECWCQGSESVKEIEKMTVDDPGV